MTFGRLGINASLILFAKKVGLAGRVRRSFVADVMILSECLPPELPGVV
jgi:hypothetical protein